ncbi:CRAL/TRIO domain-containing protein [Purpureocillium lavendulum]|uniref:CRAL/TRIO domain-containing protein n=1 Tax=Purpureocillium lavendulum TaxID=1247861 RepID=A0AB34FT47_9HYPO|nr:CRAL/TRIO domain-containing protein [Purpureocillium lavendulum]
MGKCYMKDRMPSPEACYGSLLFCAFGHYNRIGESYVDGQACAKARGFEVKKNMSIIVDHQAYIEAVQSLGRADGMYTEYARELQARRALLAAGTPRRSTTMQLGRMMPDMMAQMDKLIREKEKSAREGVAGAEEQARKAVDESKGQFRRATGPEVAAEIDKMISQAQSYTLVALYPPVSLHSMKYAAHGINPRFFSRVIEWVIAVLNLDT